MAPSAVKITEFVPPQALGEWIAGGVILALYGIGLAAPLATTPGSNLAQLVARYFPGGPQTFAWIARYPAALLAAVHAFEVVLFDQIRLRRHGVPRFSALWCKWSLSVFIEGMGAWARVGKLIKKKELAAKTK